MTNDEKDLKDEASEIIANIRASDVPEAEKADLIRQVILDVGYQLESIPQPRSDHA